MKKITMITLITLLIALSSFNCALANNTSLPDSVQTEILKFEAAGNFAMADSFTRAVLAQAELDARQAKAQAELDARQAKAQAELDAKMDKEVLLMDYDQVWAWCDSIEKATFLSSRYDIDLEGSTNLDIMVSMLKNAVSDRLTIRREIDKKTSKLIAANATLIKELKQIKKQVAQNTNGIAANKTNISEQDLRILTLVKLATDTNAPAYEAALQSITPVVEEKATPLSE